MHIYHCALPTHPRTGLRAVGIVNGRPVWPILGGSGEGGGGEGGSGSGSGSSGGSGSGDGGQGSGGGGYSPPASQAELDRIVQDRLARERAKFADYDDLKKKAERADKLDYELASEKDKAVADARKEERDKAFSEATPRVVRAEFRAEAKGVLTPDQLTALLEDLDLGKYVDSKGEVDAEKIAKKVAAFAPNGGNGGSGNNGRRPGVDLGQGNRRPAGTQPGEAGRAMAQKRFGDKARGASSS